MGVVYKLLPRIREFLIKQKKNDSNLSCRKASILIEKKYKIRVSKSSINLIIKKSGLSSSVGRTRKRKQGMVEGAGLGSMLLKGADLIVGGSTAINEAIKNKGKTQGDSSLLEALIYISLFKNASSQALTADSGLWKLIEKRCSLQAINAYLADLQGVTSLDADILGLIPNFFPEVCFIKFTFSNNRYMYIDGKFMSVWSTPHIPFDFSSTLYSAKSCVNKYFNDNQPLILFTAPGYDIPPIDFFELLLLRGLDNPNIDKVSFIGNKMEDLETISITQDYNRRIIFGLWPWQFEKSRELDIFSGYNRLYFDPLQDDYYIAEAEIKLSQPKLHQVVTLRAIVLKKSIKGKVLLLIATNIPKDKLSSDEVVRAYLDRWPNSEEAFVDYSRKIELFTYTASSRREFSIYAIPREDTQNRDISAAFEYYLRCLDYYLRWHIFPSDYEDVDFSTMKERFYGLKAKIKRKKDYQRVSFFLPKGYSFKNDLIYACQRLNERNIMLPDKKRLWFRVE